MTKPAPSVLLALLLGALFVFFAIGAAFALRLPNLGIDVDLGPKGQLLVVSINRPEKPVALPATLISISSTRGPPQRIVLENDHHLIVETQTAPQKSSVLVQDRLRAMAETGPLILEMHDARGQIMSIERTAAGYNALTLRFWMLGLAGLTCAFISAWVFSLRPSFFAAKAVLLIGVSLVGVCLPTAVTFAGDFIIGGTFWLQTQVCNYLSTQIFVTGLVVLLCQYPRKLISGAQSYCLIVVFLLPTIFLIDKWRDPIASYDYMNVVVLFDLILIVAAAFWQWRATKHDPVGRAYIHLVGAAWVIVLTLWVVVFLVPVFMGGVPPLDFSIGMWFMVPPFFAMAYGVGKGFMFEASTWAGRLLLSATTLLALLAVDLALVYAAGLDSGAAASGAFFIIGSAWFLARNALAARFLGKDTADTTGLFNQAVGVAMARDDAERASKWQAALKAIFQPLDLQIQTAQGLQQGVVSGGLGLAIPALRFAPPILLTSKRAGTQVFTNADVATVETLKAMCERIDADRDAYDRGTQTERGRIARDLHDDVSSRLLTSLHRTQPDRVQADVREALSDIRSIISGLEGDRQPISDVLSAIRIEALDRFEAAGIEAAWPLDSDALPAQTPLDYRIYRNLNAVMREITSNIIRHAKATRVEVVTSLMAGEAGLICTVDVTDDGIGLDVDHRKGSGLTNIGARMSEIGGKVTFNARELGCEAVTPKSADDKNGMRVSLEFPISPL